MAACVLGRVAFSGHSILRWREEVHVAAGRLGPEKEDSFDVNSEEECVC